MSDIVTWKSEQNMNQQRMGSGRNDPPSRAESCHRPKNKSGETTNDEKFLKTMVCIESKTFEQIPEVQRTQKTLINKVWRCLLRRQDNYLPGAEKNDHYFTAQETFSDQQNVRSSKDFLVAETNKGDTKQTRRMHPKWLHDRKPSKCTHSTTEMASTTSW